MYCGRHALYEAWESPGHNSKHMITATFVSSLTSLSSPAPDDQACKPESPAPGLLSTSLSALQDCTWSQLLNPFNYGISTEAAVCANNRPGAAYLLTWAVWPCSNADGIHALATSVQW